MKRRNEELVLCRTEAGDWTLHPPESLRPTLKSGPAQKVGDKWNRPNKEDYDIAWMMYRHLQAMHKRAGQEPYPKGKKKK